MNNIYVMKERHTAVGLENIPLYIKTLPSHVYVTFSASSRFLNEIYHMLLRSIVQRSSEYHPLFSIPLQNISALPDTIR